MVHKAVVWARPTTFDQSAAYRLGPVKPIHAPYLWWEGTDLLFTASQLGLSFWSLHHYKLSPLSYGPNGGTTISLWKDSFPSSEGLLSGFTVLLLRTVGIMTTPLYGSVHSLVSHPEPIRTGVRKGAEPLLTAPSKFTSVALGYLCDLSAYFALFSSLFFSGHFLHFLLFFFCFSSSLWYLLHL